MSPKPRCCAGNDAAPLPSQVQFQALRECLIKHTIPIRGEYVSRPLNIAQAADRRDAFVKVQSHRAGQDRDGWAGPSFGGNIPWEALPLPRRAKLHPMSPQGIYGHLFLWIVKKINATIFTPPGQDPRSVRRAIGLLDIFGFENFQKNRYKDLNLHYF